MPSNFKLATDARTTGRNGFAAAVGALCNAGKLEIRSGAPPAETTTPDSGTKLAEFTLANPAFNTASGGSANLAAVASVTGLATGTAGHYRIKTSAGVTVMQGTAGAAADTPDLTLNTASIASGDPVSIVGFTVAISS